jgi:hypothetical protein
LVEKREGLQALSFCFVAVSGLEPTPPDYWILAFARMDRKFITNSNPDPAISPD